jgi:BMFP domain-containing protein YqiC
MPQTSSRIFDDLSRLMSDAVGLAEGARREVETLARSKIERLMAGMDFVSREEFDAVSEMAALARAQNEKLEARVAALEAKLGETKP